MEPTGPERMPGNITSVRSTMMTSSSYTFPSIPRVMIARRDSRSTLIEIYSSRQGTVGWWRGSRAPTRIARAPRRNLRFTAFDTKFLRKIALLMTSPRALVLLWSGRSVVISMASTRRASSSREIRSLDPAGVRIASRGPFPGRHSLGQAGPSPPGRRPRGTCGGAVREAPHMLPEHHDAACVHGV